MLLVSILGKSYSKKGTGSARALGGLTEEIGELGVLPSELFERPLKPRRGLKGKGVGSYFIVALGGLFLGSL
jgi:hypothetical protein